MSTTTLSPAQEQELNTALKNVTNQEYQVIDSWTASFGEINTSGSKIDFIVKTVNSRFAANPPTSLMEIQSTNDIRSLLGNTPPAAEPIIPCIVDFANALGATAQLLNTRAMGT
jgi:hypothetical protein